MSIAANPQVQQLVELSLQEDLSLGDPSSELLLRDDLAGKAILRAKEDMRVCGLPLIDLLFQSRKQSLRKQLLIQEGESVSAGTELATLEATALDLLAVERTLLNFLQRLSGIATFTSRVCEQAGLESAGEVCSKNWWSLESSIFAW